MGDSREDRDEFDEGVVEEDDEEEEEVDDDDDKEDDAEFRALFTEHTASVSFSEEAALDANDWCICDE